MTKNIHEVTVIIEGKEWEDALNKALSTISSSIK